MALSFYGAGTLSGVGTGATPASGNNGYTGSAAQTELRSYFIDVLEPNLFFYRAGQMETISNGYLTRAWARMEKTDEDKVTETTGGGGLTATGVPTTGYTVGLTPADTDQPFGVITVNPRQFAIKNTVTDMMIQFSVLDHVKQGMKHFAKAMARRIDKEIQNTLYNGLTSTANSATPRTIYVDHKTGGTVDSIDDYEGDDYKGENLSNGIMRVTDIDEVTTYFEENSADRFGGMGVMGENDTGHYILIVHTKVAHRLKTEGTAVGGFLNIFAQTPKEVQRIVNGYVGTIYGVHVMSSPFVQTKDSSADNTKVTVYPSYGIAPGLFGVLKYQFNTYYVPLSAIDTADPMAQRAIYGVKMTTNFVVLDKDCGVIVYSVA